MSATPDNVIPFDSEPLEALRARLAEAEEKLEALRTGAVDALVVGGPDGPKVYVLQSADHPYRMLVEQMQDAALTLDKTGEVLYCNSCFGELAGVPGERILGRRLGDFVQSEDRLLLETALATARNNPTRVELHLLGPEGHGTPAHFAFSPLRTEQFDGICLIVTDLTEHYRARELIASGRKKDEFLAMLAHEFRNPLAPIRHAVDVLRLLEPGDERFGQMRDLIGRQTHHLSRLVDDLLDISRVTQGKINLQIQPVDVNRVLSEGVELARPLIDERRHRLTLRPLIEPARVAGDFTRLVQVVGNLLNNAAKYTAPGGEILASVERDGRWVAIRVVDNGMGIAADLLPRVFDLFTQASRAPDRAPGGLGIGLSLVHSIVALHGGSVEAKSDGAQKGSEFVVRLPLSAERCDAASDAEPRPVGRSSRRIVVIDDNRDAADSMATLLQLRGHAVQVAYDGPSGLALALAHRPHVAFVDIGLPGLDGYELARQLRARGAGLVLVALTGYGRDEDRILSKDAGFDHHLVKPVPGEALERLLADAPGSG
ncbi:MAG TPA: ATP-binding protein [Burkholderiales bacterium]